MFKNLFKKKKLEPAPAPEENTDFLSQLINTNNELFTENIKIEKQVLPLIDGIVDKCKYNEEIKNIFYNSFLKYQEKKNLDLYQQRSSIEEFIEKLRGEECHLSKSTEVDQEEEQFFDADQEIDTVPEQIDTVPENSNTIPKLPENINPNIIKLHNLILHITNFLTELINKNEGYRIYTDSNTVFNEVKDLLLKNYLGSFNVIKRGSIKLVINAWLGSKNGQNTIERCTSVMKDNVSLWKNYIDDINFLMKENNTELVNYAVYGLARTLVKKIIVSFNADPPVVLPAKDPIFLLDLLLSYERTVGYEDPYYANGGKLRRLYNKSTIRNIIKKKTHRYRNNNKKRTHKRKYIKKRTYKRKY